MSVYDGENEVSCADETTLAEYPILVMLALYVIGQAIKEKVVNGLWWAGCLVVGCIFISVVFLGGLVVEPRETIQELRRQARE